MKTGFIYRNEKGEFLLRIINRGRFDEDHYVLKFVTAFEWGCLFYSEIVLDENDRDLLTKIKYRTLFSKEVIADCACENVVVSGDPYNGFWVGGGGMKSMGMLTAIMCAFGAPSYSHIAKDGSCWGFGFSGRHPKKTKQIITKRQEKTQ